ncbi:hypothetical protein N7603_00475 [Acholeplasma vituli]|uniref:HEPN domain-containing protein n=1 Tax=Paracholeplasma vituli TaxID=69473 RepID=A0ABT2PTI1_9MOLU|nr:hypothetical protein [Paracholeplasma vituli]MCU0104135.1 hypothetical protein [Paracholeplasma vituli]
MFNFGNHDDITKIVNGVSIEESDFKVAYKKWAIYYYESAIKAATYVINNSDINLIVDTNTLPTFYLFRHAIELLLKSILIKNKSKTECISIFESNKHDLKALFDVVSTIRMMPQEEYTWISKYFDNINIFDQKSDLFRYPFPSTFLAQYKNKYLDILIILNCLNSVFLLVHDFYCDDKLASDSLQENIDYIYENSPDATFLCQASNGYGNCYLWQMYEMDSFKQIEGYKSIGDLLYREFTTSGDVMYIPPMIFMYRNLIELLLKDIGISLHPNVISEIKRRYVVNITQDYLKSHELRRGLWSKYKFVFEYYANIEHWQTTEIHILEKYIKSIDKLDRNGDKFRYPTNKSLELYHKGSLYDPNNMFYFFNEAAMFIEGMLMHIEATNEFLNEY